MKKVLALVLAVMMLATVAFAKSNASVCPGGSIKIDSGTPMGTSVTYYNDANTAVAPGTNLVAAVRNENYTVGSIKYYNGCKNLIKGITIDDKEEKVKISFVQDFTNTVNKAFDVEYTLKGRGKVTLTSANVAAYNAYKSASKVPGERVTIPDVKVRVVGTVGYGKVEVSLGDENEDELENIAGKAVTTGTGTIDFDEDIIRFVKGSSTNAVGNSKRVAGSTVADAILLQEYNDLLTLEARVYAGDQMYLNVSNTPDLDLVRKYIDNYADMDFFIFEGTPTFSSTAKLYFEEAGEDDFVYELKDNGLTKVGKYDDEEGCWIVRARTLGTYVVSDQELKTVAPSAADTNPDTGANDVVGIATALAAVALVSAAAVSLKK